jgi:hypothetical protein
VVFFAAVVIGLAARSRTDRRSLLNLISTTDTTTARALRSKGPVSR